MWGGEVVRKREMMLELQFLCSTCALKLTCARANTHTHTHTHTHTPQAIETSTDNCFIYSSPEIVETLLYCQTLSQAMWIHKQKNTRGLLGSHFLLEVTSINWREKITSDWRRPSAEELMLLNCGVGEDSFFFFFFNLFIFLFIYFFTFFFNFILFLNFT